MIIHHPDFLKLAVNNNTYYRNPILSNIYIYLQILYFSEGLFRTLGLFRAFKNYFNRKPEL